MYNQQVAILARFLIPAAVKGGNTMSYLAAVIALLALFVATPQTKVFPDTGEPFRSQATWSVFPDTGEP